MTKISELPVALSVTPSDLVVIVQGPITKQATVGLFQDAVTDINTDDVSNATAWPGVTLSDTLDYILDVFTSTQVLVSSLAVNVATVSALSTNAVSAANQATSAANAAASAALAVTSVANAAASAAAVASAAVTTLTATVSTLDTRVGVVSAALTSVESTVSGTILRVDAVSAAVVSVNSYTSALYTIVSAIQTSVAANSSALNVFEARVSAVSGAVTSVNSVLATVSGRVDVVSAGLTSANTVIATVSGRVDVVSAAVTSTNTVIATVSAAVTSVVAVVSALTTRVDTVSGAVTTLSTAVTSVASVIATVSANVTSALNLVSALEVRVSSVSTNAAFKNRANTFTSGDQTIVCAVFVCGNLTVDGGVLFVDTSSNRVGIGTTSPLGTLQITSDMTTNPDTGAYGQLELTASGANSTRRLALGYNTAGGYGVIQAIQNASTYRNLVLQPPGGNVGIGNVNPTALLTVGTPGTRTGTMSLAGASAGTLTIQPPTIVCSYTLTLPASAGAANAFLNTNGSGVTSWSSVVDYTPVWTAVTSNPSIGNGSITGKYVRVADWVIGYMQIQMGSTTTYGTGDYIFAGHPAAASAISWYNFNSTGNDVGTSLRFGLTFPATTSSFYILTFNGGYTLNWSPTTPHVWGSADSIFVPFYYRVA